MTSVKKIQIAVFASGTGSNFEALADYFANHFRAEIILLVCDQPGALVIEKAKKRGIETHLVECTRFKTKLEEKIETQVAQILFSKKVDLIVLAGYMRILKTPLLHPFAGRIINLHPSLLPSFRGLNAIQQALQYGVKVTGCTVHLVDEEVDHGPILAQVVVWVDEKDTLESLSKKIHEEEHQLLPKIVEQFIMEEPNLNRIKKWVKT